MASPQFKVGMLGYGLSAKVFHIPFIQQDPNFKLHAIVQRNPTPENDAKTDHPGAVVYNSVDELYRDPDVDLVIVGTPPGSHLSLTKQALESGKHVVVEKPFTPTSAEADELIATAEKHGRVLAVYQNRRWDVDFLTLKALVADGTLGRVVEFATHFDRWSPKAPTTWKAATSPGSGVVYDLGTHLMDQVVQLFGMPKRVTGFLHPQRLENPSGMEDSCTILLHYDGMLATAKASVVSPEVKQLRYWVRGDKGSYTKFDLDPQEPQLKGGMTLQDAEFGLEGKDKYGILRVVGDDGKITERRHPNAKAETYSRYYALLAKALKGEGPPPVTAEEGRNVIRLVELARKSAQTGKTLEVS